jgi:trimeric autotransporter adhesin
LIFEEYIAYSSDDDVDFIAHSLLNFHDYTTLPLTFSVVGVITTVAGSGKPDYSGDGAQATLATLNIPEGVAVGALGNIYIADTYNHRIRMVTKSSGIITTVAGNGTAGYSGDGRQATSAKLKFPAGVAVDVSGNIYIADTSNYCIRLRNEGTGIISTVAGTGTSGYSGDGGQATLARLSNPQGIAVDVLGNIYVADQFNNRIRIITKSNGVITTVAGTGGAGAFNGDGGKATSAVIDNPGDVAVDASGNIYIIERERHRVRMVTQSTGLITTVAGDGTASFNGNGGQATSAGLSNPYGVAVDISGNLYITQGTLDDHRVRMVTKSSGIITTVAGTGTSGYSGDGAQATAAKLNGPQSVAVDALGNVCVADTYNNRIRIFAANAQPTSAPSAAPTFTSSPSAAPTSTSSSTAAPTSTSSSTAAPTSTSSPTAAPTSTPSPSTVPATSVIATTPTTSSTALSGNVLPGVIGGVGGFLLILVILAVICFCRRR